jgi:hypothetical protein
MAEATADLKNSMVEGKAENQQKRMRCGVSVSIPVVSLVLTLSGFIVIRSDQAAARASLWLGPEPHRVVATGLVNSSRVRSKHYLFIYYSSTRTA